MYVRLGIGDTIYILNLVHLVFINLLFAQEKSKTAHASDNRFFGFEKYWLFVTYIVCY